MGFTPLYFTVVDAVQYSLMKMFGSHDWTCEKPALELKRVHLCNQESEAAKLGEEWCTLALKRLKEASP
jgi:hypothetical protein